ncbi:hypothetical protein EIP75_13735 [Aquabacterium soli]|uniref:Uncharacterized protein n=1 Tax=Aquabacterium soli TaxID=2493092 RepID=A0A3R8S253_9BURK|nr:hypothetical protein [Aquabacterium soli]RRS03653.1 hypothetical protein EIP75_13735 [Aquabacterium soli]
MADKTLTEAAWKSLTKGKAVTADADVLKALALLARADKLKPDATGLAQQRDALAAVDKALATFEKANAKTAKADKALQAGLSDMSGGVERSRKAVEQQIRDLATSTAKAKAAAPDEDEGDDTPDILTTRMVPLLRQVRAGTPAHTKLVLSGKEVVVLLSRKPISPARRTLMVEQLEQKGSVKVIDGTCVLDNKFITFVLDNPASGLAKKISAALLKQTGLRVPVRVRGPDGDIDEDDDDEEAVGAKDKPQATSTTSQQATVDKGRFVNHAKSRLAWEKVRQKLQADLKSLESAVLGYCKGQPDLAGPATAKVRKLDTILVELDESLMDILDKALNAQTDQKRLDLHEESRAVLARYIRFVKSDPLLAGVDQNPFVPLKTREFLLASLQALDKSLA